MGPVVAFVLADILAKKSGRKTASRVLREHPVITAGAFAWGVWHIYFENWSYDAS